MKLIVLVIFILSAIGSTCCATLRDDRDFSNSREDLLYSDDSRLHQRRERLYRQLRNYGVPSDVAHMYVPRGMTIGELLGQDKNNTAENTDVSSTVDPWSIVWYIGSFGGLIAFFLVISCSEWCCLKSRTAATLVGVPIATPATVSTRCPPNATRQLPVTCDTPPPGYHLFAPPSYNDSQMFEKNKYDVFVVPVHSVAEMETLPPKYGDVFKS